MHNPIVNNTLKNLFTKVKLLTSYPQLQFISDRSESEKLS